MSLAVQANRQDEKFDVDAGQFEEIIAASRDESLDLAMPRKETSEISKDSELESNADKNVNGNATNYSSSEEDSYDDDFDSDVAGDETARKSAVDKEMPRDKLSSKRRYSPRAKNPSDLSPRTVKKGKKKAPYKPYMSPRTSSPATSRMPPAKDWSRPNHHSAEPKNRTKIDQTVVDRVLSANRHKVTKLECRLTQLIKELTKEREENKTLRIIQHRQEKKLEKVIGDEAELPQLLVKHTAEVRNLRERIRKLQDASHQKDVKLVEQDKVILKLRDRCKYYRDLCDKEELVKKSDLEKNLTKAEENLKKRDEEILKLQRMLNLNEKSHSRNLKEQKEKLKEAVEKIRIMEENCNNLQGKLRVREKQLDYTNIYQRQIVLKDKGNDSSDSTPKMAALPAPKRAKQKVKGSNGITKKATKESSRDITKENSSLSAENEQNWEKPNSVFLTAQSDKESGSDQDISKKDGENALSITDGLTANNILSTGLRGLLNGNSESVEKQKIGDFEKHLREEDERLRKEKEELEMKLKETLEREEREKAEREAKWREDSARKAREDEERRMEEKRKEEQIAEQRRLKDEEFKRKEREMIAQDEESRRKKDALLARLKAMDDSKDSDKDPLDFENMNSLKAKEEFSKPFKSYDGRQADKNLHSGLPAVPKESRVILHTKDNPVTSPSGSAKSDPDGVFGIPRHKPVLLGRGDLTKKKDNQFSWLDDSKKPAQTNNGNKPNDVFNFGDYTPSMNDGKKMSDMFDGGLSRKAGHGRRREGGMVDDVLNFGSSGGVEKSKLHDNSLGFLSDNFSKKRSAEPTNNNTTLLPRRRAAQERTGPTTISSALDDNLDDIEEFAL